MAGTAQDVLNWARSQLGQTDGAKYFEICGSEDLGDWCVAFTLAGYTVCDVDIAWPPEGLEYKRFMAPDWHDAPPGYTVNPQEAGPAYMMCFDWNKDAWGDHVGFFDCKDGDGFWSYEGNTSGGKVAHKWHPWSDAVCAVRPIFKGGKWIKEKGRWWYRHNDGSCTKQGWECIDGEWYWFDKDGWMAESTVINDGTGYYVIGKSGAMLTDLKTHTAHDGRYGAIEL